ncbi:helix-turn-helix domain-containing protein [Anderseniella sp. Alg231-50]|uniref:helix-turn-helix domain-containing protein n=1 Tax=Anderseniella sp. Alg231-50 TaxID=1922226 RepID=UPI00307C1E6F
MDVHVEEYQSLPGLNDARRSNLFSRTNGFLFSDPGNGHLTTSTATTDKFGIRIGRVRSTGHEIDLTELNHSTMLLPVQGLLEARSRRAEHSCRQGEALLFGPNRRTTRAVSEGGEHFEANVVLFPTDVLMANLDRQALERTGDLLESGVAVHDADAASVPLLKFCDFLSAAIMNGSAALGNRRHVQTMEALLIELYGEFISRLAEKTAGRKAPSAGARYVVKAEEYMRANLDEPLTVAEIAAAIGVSQRSLQLAFREVRSATPREILALMRLHLVHEKLKSDKSGAGVTDIALECGVANIGRFASCYREVYGEKPSTTRRRARAGLARTR